MIYWKTDPCVCAKFGKKWESGSDQNNV